MDQKHRTITFWSRRRRVRFQEHYDTMHRCWWGHALNLDGLTIGLRRGQKRADLVKEARQVAGSFIDIKPRRKP